MNKKKNIKNKFNYKKYFEGKKITLMGLGGFSRSLIEAEFLAKNGADLIITDLTPEKDLQKELKALKKYKNIKYTLGEHKIEDFKNRDIVFSANGVPLGNKYIEISKKYSKITTKTIAYVFWILQKEKEENNFQTITIGITGTKGKSTTTSLVEKLIKTDFEEKGSKNNVFVGGNVRGTANLTILPKIKDGDIVVAELDSWLLQGFGNLKLSPEISVFTNFFNDHQNYYHSMEKYYKDKSFVFEFQKKENVTIFTNQSINAYKKYFNKRVDGEKIIARTCKLPKWNYTIFGNHNLKNITQAVEVGKFLNISQKNMKKAFEKYIPEDGRFQRLDDKNGFIFFNDNNATMPESSAESIKSLRKKFKNSNIFLIAGGSDKNFEDADYSKLAKTYENNIKFSVYFKGSGTDILLDKFSKKYLKNQKDNFKIISKMQEAFKIILPKMKKNDILVLSPGMASFGCFKNEYDRNDQFIKEFDRIK